MKKTHSIYKTPIQASKTMPRQNTIKHFAQQEIHLSQTPLFFPEGYENVFLGFYFISFPYIAGLLFQFFYIADAQKVLFLSIHEQTSFLLTWAIGYEIIASMILLYIFKMAISFTNESRKPKVKTFRRP